MLENVVRPLLLSAAPSPSSKFRAVVQSVINDIHRVLGGNRVNLKDTIAKYFKAVAVIRFDKAIEAYPIVKSLGLSNKQIQCGSEVAFDHIYTNKDSAAQLIDMFQNISVAFAVIKQVTM